MTNEPNYAGSFHEAIDKQAQILEEVKKLNMFKKRLTAIVVVMCGGLALFGIGAFLAQRASTKAEKAAADAERAVVIVEELRFEECVLRNHNARNLRGTISESDEMVIEGILNNLLLVFSDASEETRDGLRRSFEGAIDDLPDFGDVVDTDCDRDGDVDEDDYDVTRIDTPLADEADQRRVD